MADFDVERHDGDVPAVCVGQWCCGCRVHPVGKPWGWNCVAWGRHLIEAHCYRALEGSRDAGNGGPDA